jgi:hypothetical protein
VLGIGGGRDVGVGYLTAPNHANIRMCLQFGRTLDSIIIIILCYRINFKSDSIRFTRKSLPRETLKTTYLGHLTARDYLGDVKVV